MGTAPTPTPTPPTCPPRVSKDIERTRLENVDVNLWFKKIERRFALHQTSVSGIKNESRGLTRRHLLI